MSFQIHALPAEDFTDPGGGYIHLHNAGPGCFAAAVTHAGENPQT